MKYISILISTLLFLTSCKSQKASDEIIIEGQVKNIPDGVIYLTEAHSWQVHLDSTTCNNGHFQFRMKTDSAFVPYMASIHFPDSSKPMKVGGLFFRNYMLAADSMKYAGDAFYLERGFTRIEGDNQKKPYLRVFAGKETDVMYKNQFTDFGWIGNIDSSIRLQRITSFKNEIRKHPFSYFLLENIYEAKEQYSKREMSEILSMFDDDVHKSRLGERIKAYLVNRPDPNAPYPNLSLVNSINQRGNIIDPTAKLNMLVFWASWCKPCRMEIPTLKEIQQKYEGKGLNLVSISIDDIRDNWEKALKQEKMVWRQYLVDKDKIDQVKQQFNFAAIPLVVFTDKSGKEIMKYVGYEKEQEKNYDTVIKNFLALDR